MKHVLVNSTSSDIQVLKHHIYEYRKGIRNMVLHTIHSCEYEQAKYFLNRKGISYYVLPVTDYKINIFFGNSDCVDIIKSFGEKSLVEYSDEEDFMLGIMLGYDRKSQCERYIKRKYERINKAVNE